MIHHNHKLIGVLKALGYHNWQLTVALVLTIIWPLFIFAIIGVAISVFISHILINSHNLYLALINYGWYINAEMTIIIVTIPLLLLIILSFIIVYLFLQKRPLDLISSRIFKKHHHLTISRIFSFFAATLMLFSVAASGLVNDMLVIRFEGINFNYLSNYHYQKIGKNFINSNKQLVYSMNSIAQVESGTSLKQNLEDAINSYLTNPNNPAPVIRDVRNKYILGSELLKMRKNLEKPTIWNLLSPTFKKQWMKQINVINYLTNDNGNDSKDLLISFATIPYQEQNELPFIKIDIEDSYDLDFSHNNHIGNSYDSITQTFNTSCFTNRVTMRQYMVLVIIAVILLNLI